MVKKSDNLESSSTENIDSKKNAQIKKLFKVRNLKNRPHEIIVKQTTIRWEPRGINPIYPVEYQNGVPEEIINDKNFIPQKKYFHIEG